MALWIARRGMASAAGNGGRTPLTGVPKAQALLKAAVGHEESIAAGRLNEDGSPLSEAADEYGFLLETVARHKVGWFFFFFFFFFFVFLPSSISMLCLTYFVLWIHLLCVFLSCVNLPPTFLYIA